MKRFLLLMAFFASLSAWAIEQDNDGYYLIGSAADWDEFAAIVLNTNASANAIMIADVDLGDDQTRIGDTRGNELGVKYSGTFDGQGHTLTIAYNITGNNMCAPFTKVNGATIKNLHVNGTLVTMFCHCAGVIADAYGTTTIENIWVSADITSKNTSYDECAAFVGCKKNGTLIIKDCLFSGSIITINNSIWNGAFLGFIDGENYTTATITNCLSTGTFNYSTDPSNIPNRGTIINSYIKQFPTSIPEEMQCTDEQLADGTIATALQAGREEEVWVQDTENGTPMLKIFMQTSSMLGDVNNDHSVDINDVTDMIDYVLGKPVTPFNEINANVCDDATIDINDVTTLINFVLTGTWE